MSAHPTPSPSSARPVGALARFLDGLERVGNKLPDPAILFVWCLVVVLLLSKLLSGTAFDEIDPRTKAPLVVRDLLTGTSITGLLSVMVKEFTGFHPLGVVLVSLLGVGVAEHAGFINACLKRMLAVTPRALLTPMVILVAIVSHTAADAGYVLVIPLAGVIFAAAGRHPLAGIAAAFAGVSGGFSANFIVSSLDPMLSGITQQAAQLIDPARAVNPVCNWYFTGASSVLIIAVGWLLTDRFVEPRLARTPVDGDGSGAPKMAELSPREDRALWWGLGALALGVAVLVFSALPATSPLRDAPAAGATAGSLTSANAGLMKIIVPLIFLLFLLPGVVYGFAAGTFKSSRDVIKGMSQAMSSMGYYLVMAFFASQFIYAFGYSNLGVLFALKGAAFLQQTQLPDQVTIVGIIFLTATVNLLIGSASAKWALLAPIFVPMLMSIGLSPELTQAAYRVGDSTTNIITPLMPYFPLVVVYAQRYVKSSGIGTITALMLPYSLTFLVLWTIGLIAYWQLGLPLGPDAPYAYTRP
jgi:aminobenzoyl-glutamate transport protein